MVAVKTSVPDTDNDHMQWSQQMTYHWHRNHHHHDTCQSTTSGHVGNHSGKNATFKHTSQTQGHIHQLGVSFNTAGNCYPDNNHKTTFFWLLIFNPRDLYYQNHIQRMHFQCISLCHSYCLHLLCSFSAQYSPLHFNSHNL